MRPVEKKGDTPQYDPDAYDVMRGYLFQQIGSYCSYCEQPISNDSAVEHKVPKSERSGGELYDTKWYNLLLSCQSCNSAKGDKDPQALGVSYRTALELWVWPDTTPKNEIRHDPEYKGNETNKLFKFVRDARSQAQLCRDGFLSPTTWGK